MISITNGGSFFGAGGASYDRGLATCTTGRGRERGSASARFSSCGFALAPPNRNDIVVPDVFATSWSNGLRKTSWSCVLLEARLDCSACSGVTQKHRLAERSWTQVQIIQRIEAQWPVEKKIALSEFVIWTEGSLEVHAKQVERILQQVRARQTALAHSNS